MNNRKLFMGAVDNVKGEKVFAAYPGVTINEKHSLEVAGYEEVLYDSLLREFPIEVGFNTIEASGTVHVFNEQKKLPNNTMAMDPKLGVGATTADFGSTISDTDYSRDNFQNAVARLYGGRIQYDYFTMKMEQRYGSFEDLTVKDYNDMIVGFNKTKANDFFNGRSTALDDVASTYKFETTGILSQITDTGAIADGVFIADAINSKIASLQARLDYTGMPDVICMNAATYDMMVQEERGRANYMQEITSDIVPGWNVRAINTYAGTLPIMITPFIKPTVVGGTTTHTIVALNRKYIDKVWWINNGPQFFEFASADQPLANQRLLTDKQMLEYMTYILRFPYTGMHFRLTKVVTA